ncbi:serine kinase of the HPr protein, regulates carbohydrate metabolism [Terriglobus roseus DSM 18391]|uniref:Serine kinase of the HPr protein, regulates carbohydrate metabolism n=1 Tax=Terriglobus roseus (strain DSM 18391 / NRRL B-41598 / KBS 63) TaxID=926566 RepID=I3ZDW3_TERRK|nr:serine kinase of the HPr protein, regulates carbohydrate metabolism [Terriglobus roseus]AFL87431.1 serine kinase of the HPr protein, regulates carbohydrate metabolism [Terriglobus roseus DSM 18391]
MNNEFEITGVPDAKGVWVESLPEHLEDAVGLAAFWQARRGTLLLRVPYVGAYRVTNGDTIEVCPIDGVDPAALDLYLYGAARAALLHQRGELPLHASSLVPPGGDRAIALCGPSGAGKSTLAVELSRRGWTLVADDTTRVQCKDGTPMAWPSHPSVKLWHDTCDNFNVPVEGLRRVREDMNKFYFEMPVHPETVVLGSVVELLTTEGGLERVTSLPERMSLLSKHAFRPFQIAALQVQAQHMQTVATVATACNLWQLHGARVATVSALADSVEETAAWQSK